MDFLKLCADRYSVRSFSDETVDDATLCAILEAGRLAPTAKNLQSQRIYVIKSERAMNTLTSLKSCYGAPVVLMVCGDTDVACNRPIVDHSMAEMDATIVATHMMLAATSLGVGSCWICAFETEAVANAFDLPVNETPYLLLALGYPSETAAPSPRHTLREPLENTVTVL